MIPNNSILLVEDDEVDVLRIKEAFKELEISLELIVARDGEEALRIVRNAYRDMPRIILLDLNLPKMNGLELLRILKQDDLLKLIPVIILTASDDETDIIESVRLDIAGYIVKSTEYSHFVETLRIIGLYCSMFRTFDFPTLI